jgi:pyridoxal phosphate enzyme (YggS family)
VSLDTTIRTNLDVVRDRIRRAAERASRDPADIRLIAISKTFGPDHVRAAAAAGQVEFGENRVQEALQKIAQTADLEIRWHLVGHLQSNKVRRAVPAFAAVQSVDRLDLLERLDLAAAEHGASPEVLIQVSLAQEPTKFGARPDEVSRLVAAAETCRAVRLAGLMLLPPFFDDVEAVRPYFARLRRLRDDLVEAGTPGGRLRELSMGMSHDFEAAVEEGATIVRVGTAIFGSRPPVVG